MLIANEFAAVTVELDETGNGPRLRIEDVRTHRTLYLDPLELESVAWCSHEDLAPILDPGITRWRGDYEGGAN